MLFIYFDMKISAPGPWPFHLALRGFQTSSKEWTLLHWLLKQLDLFNHLNNRKLVPNQFLPSSRCHMGLHYIFAPSLDLFYKIIDTYGTNQIFARKVWAYLLPKYVFEHVWTASHDRLNRACLSSWVDFTGSVQCQCLDHSHL
jgi:hypothetical protein